MIIKKSLIVTFICLSLFGCNSQKSLQQYMAESSENPNFLAFDLGTQVFDIDKKELSEDQKETLKSIKKLNIVAFRKKEDNVELYNQEKAEVRRIMRENSKYEELINIKSTGGRFIFYSLGAGDYIDEAVLFVNSDDFGFAIVRLLGKKMQPNNIMDFVSILEKSRFDQDLVPFFEILK